METRTNLDKWLYLVRRIEEHREEKAVKDLQKLYKQLIKDLRKVMGNVYADYADPATGKLTYEALHRQGLDARLLEEVAANVASVTADEGRIIRETVEQTYANCYSGMVQAVQNAVDNEELHEAFAAVEAVKPEVIKAAVNNPVHGLTLSDQLEKNRADIIWGIKQAVGVGLSEGDNYSTMARRIQKELIGRDGSGGSYYKSIRIARTEAHRVREEGNLDAAQNLTEKLEPAGISMMKTWHTMKDERVRPSRSRKTKGGWKYSKSGKYDHQKMEGVQVPINEEFELPSGAKTMAPGKSGVAGEDINCRCFLSYDVVKNIEYNAAIPNQWGAPQEIPDEIALKGANPLYKAGLNQKYSTPEEMEYNKNCSASVVAYEMRRKGYNVSAVGYSKSRKLAKEPFSAWENAIPVKKRYSEILEYLDTFEDGARIQVAVAFPDSIWEQRDNHTFVIERVFGKNIFIDPQTSGILSLEFMKDAASIELFRIDNAEISQRGLSACIKE